jgi:hypothetical protein
MRSLIILLPLLASLVSACGGGFDSALSSTGGTGGEPGTGGAPAVPYAIVDTGQVSCYGALDRMGCPAAGAAFHGQDAQWLTNAPSYTTSADGLTVRDEVTGLTWQRSPDTNGDGALGISDKLDHPGAVARCEALATAGFGGFSDWRLPSIKELYSLILFTGTDPSGLQGDDTSGLVPFIDTAHFQFAYGNPAEGERLIDSQYASSTLYGPKSWTGSDQLFGVNFADGRIKGYDLVAPDGGEKLFFVQCVRGNPAYGINDFVEQGDATILDRATGLAWSKADSEASLDWQAALAWVAAKNAEGYLGHDDWRLPDAKELQSILDYGRSPDVTQSAAIDPIFDASAITNEAGEADYPWYWASTTHATYQGSGSGVYVAFGRAGGWQKSPPTASCYTLHDVHGAGAQRSDPKTATNLTVIGEACGGGTAHGLGPQGDVLRGENHVRLVRGGATAVAGGGGDGGAAPQGCDTCQQGSVCCPTGYGCAGQCVPDCRLGPGCPSGLSCDQATGVCAP